ncbi:MAG: magnesium and cobalt transport protein CorA [Deltaproteobacteria bacterium HGW-Deltaproteobacteria-19]|nr:MAG: magnesium and cobalt transport protein CorA [Deltaproteobacteria bacterium HGW-Deltaproteobacteria-19]
MARRRIKRSAKSGLPPGTLVHIGERRAEESRITMLRYEGEHFEERIVPAHQVVRPPRDQGGVAWYHVAGLHDVAVLARLGEVFGLHPLILEDILNTEQRPKIDETEEYVFLVLKGFVSSEEPTGQLISEQISIVFGPNWVLSLQEREGNRFSTLRDRIASCQGRICSQGADYLAYALLDQLVDGYFTVLEQMRERIGEVEDAVLQRPVPATLHAIQQLKREGMFLRKSVWPLREVVSRLERLEEPLIRPATGIYLRDVYDHVIQVNDAIENDRDMLSAMLDIYLSSINNRMNEVMKVLTVIATIFMPMTFLAGVYGMNFKHFPEIEWVWGYPYLFWGLILVMGLSMFAYFKRRKWM